MRIYGYMNSVVFNFMQMSSYTIPQPPIEAQTVEVIWISVTLVLFIYYHIYYNILN